MSRPVRVRFAPSPTGPLHIGGVRTALYNYLFARQQGGKFILRIEDTDQLRYVEGAEDYIKSSLKWFGLDLDESPDQAGDYGPYRQSERRTIYQEHAKILLERGMAYYAFDTADALDAARKEAESQGQTFKYDAKTRVQLDNSLNMSEAALQARLEQGEPYTLRLKIEPGQQIHIQDIVRGEVVFQSDELDDKVIMKADGLPTYHLANIVDDHLMEISHVIRGEEWLPSTAHHVLLYRAFGWEDSMPAFAHLPLILKPNGKGKLSKRDGAKLGIPVFPLAWEGATPEDSFLGFREFGFLPQAALNFLAFLGWNPGTEQEIFSLDALVEAFSLEKIGKSGARFDYDKARWFNQQYLINSGNADLATLLRPLAEKANYEATDDYLAGIAGLLKERAHLLPEILEQGAYFFTDVETYDQKTLRKKWKPEREAAFNQLTETLAALDTFEAAPLKATVEAFMKAQEWGYGDILPPLRLALSGTVKGPGVFEMMELMGRDTTLERLSAAWSTFTRLKQSLDT